MRRCCETGDRAFHIGGTAPVKDTVFHNRIKGSAVPSVKRAGRHNVGVAGKTKVGRVAAAASVEIVDIRCPRLGKLEPVTNEANFLQGLLHQVQCTTFFRCNTWAAD